MAEAADLRRELSEARTRIGQLEVELAEERRLSALARLTASVAHDFGNVLAAIGGCNDLMLRSIPVASDRGRPEPPAADLNTVVAGVVRTLEPLLGDQIDVRLQLDPTAGAVGVTAAALEQVAMNLVLNARDAMPSGGRLTVTTTRGHGEAGGNATLTVGDTGVGMDEATRARACEPYFTTKTGGRGAGLGLSTVFGIVGEHGGRVDVTSEPGCGSTFRVCLPSVSAPVAATTADAVAAATVVVLEDDPRVRDLIVEILESYGYLALRAGTAERRRWLSVAAIPTGSRWWWRPFAHWVGRRSSSTTGCAGWRPRRRSSISPISRAATRAPPP